MKRVKIAERQRFADDVARRDALRGTAPLKRAKAPSRRKRLRLTAACELRVLGDLLEQHDPGHNHARIGRLLERSVRLMDMQEMEYINARIDVDGTSNGPIYISQETTRSLIADCWAKVEENLVVANVAFNATADEPHGRSLALRAALEKALDYADVIYTLTPIPEELLEDDEA